MIRSGRAGLALVLASTAAGAVAAVMATHRAFTAAAILAGASVVAFTLGILLVRRADPEELKERGRENERRASALGLALAKASGGWDPRRPPRRGERKDDQDDKSD